MEGCRRSGVWIIFAIRGGIAAEGVAMGWWCGWGCSASWVGESCVRETSPISGRFWWGASSHLGGEVEVGVDVQSVCWGCRLQFGVSWHAFRKRLIRM